MTKEKDPAAAQPERFAIARGAHVGITLPAEGFQPVVEITWPDFVQLVTEFEISEDKTGAYVCRPMSGDGKRSDANAEPWPLLPLDLDELLPTDLADLEQWCATQGLDVVLATTFSHTTEAPRIRLWVHCSRPFTANEHLFLFKAFNQGAVFPFKLDPATAKPSQPIYLPRAPSARRSIAYARYFAGKKLDVDSMLRIYQEEIRARAQRDEGARFVGGKGVRQPGGLIDAFNKNVDLPALLEKHGYKRKTKSRYVAPASLSGRAAITVHDLGLISFHDPEHDPLSQRNDLNVPRVLDPFAVFAILEHDNEFLPAWKAVQKIVRSHGWMPEEIKPTENELTDYELLNVSEIPATMQARNEIVQGILEEKSVTVATGPSNSGKTTIIEYMLFCIATGQKFGGRETSVGTCIWIAGEDVHNAKARMLAMADEYGVALSALDEKLLILPQRIEVMNPKSMEILHRVVARKLGAEAKISVFVFDSKAMLWGGEDENSNDETSEFLKLVDTNFVKRYDSSAILIHHLTKAKEIEDQTARGASALINNADQEWRFEMRQASMVAVMEPAKLRTARWEPIRFLIKVVELDDFKYAHMKNNQGNMPKVSIPEASNQFGVSTKQLGDDLEYVEVLEAVMTLPAGGGKNAHSASAILKAMGKISDDSSKPDKSAARDWLRRKLQKLVEQKLLDGENGVTQAGKEFIETMRLQVPVSESSGAEAPAAERQPGEDDE